MVEGDDEMTELPRGQQDGHSVVNIDDDPEETNNPQQNESSTSGIGKMSIHHAAKLGRLNELREILRDNADSVSQSDARGRTPLHLAAENLHLECCEELLRISKKVVNWKDNSGNTPLLLSISSGDTSSEVTRLLIQHSGNVNATTKSSQTAVHIAAEKGNAKTLKLLLGNDKRNLNAEDNENTTPLHLAAKNGHVDVCQELINLGADKDARDRREHTPLHLAARRGFHACMNLLISSECQVDPVDEQGDTPLHSYCKHTKKRPECIKLLLDAKANVNLRNKCGKTPFHLAQSLPFETKKVFEASAVDLLVTDNKGKTALHYAAEKRNSCKHVDFILNMEATKTVDVEHFINIQDAQGYTALHIAARLGELDTCRSLIKKRADINSSCKNQETALHKAAENGHRQTIELLIDKGVKVNLKNAKSFTALHLAAKNGWAECCETLIRKGHNVRETDSAGNSVLHIAVEHERIPCISAIIRAHPASVSFTDENGKTPLHKAVEKKLLGCCDALLESKDIDLWTKDVPSPVRIAYENEFFDGFHLLLMKCKHGDKNQDIDFRKVLKLALQNSNRQVVQSITDSVYWEESLQPYYVSGRQGDDGGNETPNLNLSSMVGQYHELAEKVFDKCMAKQMTTEGNKKDNADVDCNRDYFKTEYLDEILEQKDEGIQDEREEFLRDPDRSASESEAFDSGTGKLKAGVRTNTANSEWRKQHVLAVAVRGNHQRLVCHPIVKRWVQYKWEKYIWLWFYISAALAAAHAVLLTTFAAVSWDWRAMYDKYGLNQSEVCKFDVRLVGPEVAELLIKEAEIPNGISYALYAIMALWLASNIYKIIRLRGLRKEIILSTVCIVADFPFLWNFSHCSQQTFVREDWQWVAGPVAVVFSWVLAYYTASRHLLYNLKFFSFYIFLSAAKDIIIPLTIPTLVGFVFYILTSKGSLTLIINMNWLFTFFQGMPSRGTLCMMVLVAVVFLARLRSDGADRGGEHEFDKIADAIRLILDFDLLFPCFRKRFYVAKIPGEREREKSQLVPEILKARRTLTQTRYNT